MNVTEYLGFEGKGSIWIISWLQNQSQQGYICLSWILAINLRQLRVPEQPNSVTLITGASITLSPGMWKWQCFNPIEFKIITDRIIVQKWDPTLSQALRGMSYFLIFKPRFFISKVKVMIFSWSACKDGKKITARALGKVPECQHSAWYLVAISQYLKIKVSSKRPIGNEPLKLN